MITPSNPVTDISFDLLAVAPEPNPTGAGTQMEGGRVCFQNSGYRVTVADDGTVTVENQHTGENYMAWGPPQVWVDGEHAFNFYGTTTLELEDGTKITITTVPWADDPLVTVSDKVTITNASYGVEVFGMHSALAGALSFVETMNYGWLLDAVVGDGNLVTENAQGAGFIGDNADGAWQQVDQAYIDATDLAVLGPLAGERGQAFNTLQDLLAITFVGSYRGPMAYRSAEFDDNPQFRHDADAEVDTGARELRLRLARDGLRIAPHVPAAGWGAP